MKAEILLGKGIEESEKNRENTAEQEKSWCEHDSSRMSTGGS